jgi:hypothetical protein
MKCVSTPLASAFLFTCEPVQVDPFLTYMIQGLTPICGGFLNVRSSESVCHFGTCHFPRTTLYTRASASFSCSLSDGRPLFSILSGHRWRLVFLLLSIHPLIWAYFPPSEIAISCTIPYSSPSLSLDDTRIQTTSYIPLVEPLHHMSIGFDRSPSRVLPIPPWIGCSKEVRVFEHTCATSKLLFCSACSLSITIFFPY